MSSTQKFILVIFSFTSIITLSQESDTLKKKNENFFGSDCTEFSDTLAELIREDDRCILYGDESKVCRVKNEKIKWAVDLKHFSKCDYFCMLIRTSAKRRKSTAVFIFAYVNDKLIGQEVIDFRSGKIIKRIYGE